MSEFLSRLGGAASNDLKGTPLDKVLNHLMGGQQGASGLEALDPVSPGWNRIVISGDAAWRDS